MKLRSSALLLLLALPARAAAQDPAARVDAVFARFTGTATPGCAVGVTRDGRPVLSRAYGMADLEHDVPNSPASVFEAGSVSKQFTAAAVVMLAEEGKLSLSDDIRKYIPEVPDYGTPITIRHLLNHTSGLRDWGSVAGIEGWPRGARVHTHEHVLDIVSRQKSLNYRPGEYYSYTNTGYNLQAILVERVSGMPFAEFTRKRIFEPLGLKDTQWRDDFTEIVKGRSIAYRPAPEGNGFRLDMPFENVHGNGGLLTTVGDLLRWTERLQTGEGLSPRFLEEMHRQAVLNGGRRIEYASGIVVTRHGTIPEVSHSGATGGYRAYAARYPEQRLAVALLCNAANANPNALARQVADVFLEGKAGAQAEPTVTLSAAALGARAGLYRDTRMQRPLRLVVEDGKLREAGGPTFEPLSEARYRVGRSRVEFEPASGGRAAFRMIEPDGDTLRFEPVPAWEPTAAQLAEFAGTYRSDEAEATVTVRAEGGKLVLKGRFGEARTLTPVYPDAFETGAGVYRFVRDPSGRVVELSSVSDRVWDIRFRRVP